MRILLIDDDALSLSSLQKALILHGFSVDAFTNPVMALEKFKREAHELVFSDVMMKGYDGLQLIGLIRDLQSETRVILFTGYYTERLAKVVNTLGVHAFYPKPVSIEALINHANEVLAETEGK
ncbi:MAG: response regulator [Candidatus Marinimicrobia bacterium]|nr:response regulator [Candidatus Neomarinimicrobiota bacterium]